MTDVGYSGACTNIAVEALVNGGLPASGPVADLGFCKGRASCVATTS